VHDVLQNDRAVLGRELARLNHRTSRVVGEINWNQDAIESFTGSSDFFVRHHRRHRT